MTQNILPYLQGTLSIPRTEISHTILARCHKRPKLVEPKSSSCYVKPASSQVAVEERREQDRGTPDPARTTSTPISQIARQKQTDKEFFANLISSAATKRDAKAYISRLKSPSKVKILSPEQSRSRPQVNLGGLFGGARAVEQSPVFTQYAPEHKGFEELETLHVALVKLGDLDQVSDNVVTGIAETLSQLARLSMLPCVVLDSFNDSQGDVRQKLKKQAERLSSAIDVVGSGARAVEDVFTIPESGEPYVALRRLVGAPLRRGLIPIIVPSAYSEADQSVVFLPADKAVLALTKVFAELHDAQRLNTAATTTSHISLDRIIVVDQAGGVPSSISADGMHVFLNLEQEHAAVSQEIETSASGNASKLLCNLRMLREALKLLPHSASGLMATPEEAANTAQVEKPLSPSSVGTRRQKNTLIYNLLTDKPSYSSSLPKGRLSKTGGTQSRPTVSTFVKHGMPLNLLPDPRVRRWTPTSPRIKLTDSQIDLDRLVYLINDSFNRELDTEHYLRRVNDRMAGVIIVGEYEGGAILTWETPPGVNPDDTDRLVPYLDKFAVLKKSQGAGGVADILFNAMVRTCFPQGVCWRSRKNNPVNKWYFERSRGTKKIPDMNWTMFWTTPGVPEDSQKFSDYEGVCRSIEASWVDKKMAAD